MKTDLKVLLFTILALVALPALAQDCKNQHFKIDPFSWAAHDPIAPYDMCWEFTKVVGTSNGSIVYCALLDELCGSEGCVGFTSDDIWGDDWTTVSAYKLYGWLELEQGDLEIVEWAIFDLDSGNETGIMKVIGGTGAYEGAFGSLSLLPAFPSYLKTRMYEVKGYVCTE